MVILRGNVMLWSQRWEGSTKGGLKYKEMHGLLFNGLQKKWAHCRGGHHFKFPSHFQSTSQKPLKIQPKNMKTPVTQNYTRHTFLVKNQ